MSYNHGLFFPDPVIDADLQEFVEQFGGDWQGRDFRPEFRQGVISDGDVHLFIRGIDNQSDNIDCYGPEEIEAVENACGFSIRGALTIDHKFGDQAMELTKRVIAKMKERWTLYEFPESG